MQENENLHPPQGDSLPKVQAPEISAPVIKNVTIEELAKSKASAEALANSPAKDSSNSPAKDSKTAASSPAGLGLRGKTTSKKPPSKNAGSHSAKKGFASISKGTNFRKIVILLIAALIIFDIVIFAIMYLSSRGDAPAYYDTPELVIQRALDDFAGDSAVGKAAYDPGFTSLNFYNPNYPVEFVNTASLKKIDNNKYKAFGPSGELYYDDLIVARVMQFNSDWSNYRNVGDQAIFSNLVANPSPEFDAKLQNWGYGYKVAYHVLTFGDMRHVGKDYYLITQATYTISAPNGASEQRDDIIVFKLRGEGDTMKIADMEMISLTPTSSVANSGAAPVANTVTPPGANG